MFKLKTKVQHDQNKIWLTVTLTFPLGDGRERKKTAVHLAHIPASFFESTSVPMIMRALPPAELFFDQSGTERRLTQPGRTELSIRVRALQPVRDPDKFRESNSGLAVHCSSACCIASEASPENFRRPLSLFSLCLSRTRLRLSA